MTMARFYENPTARAQAALLAGSAGEKKKKQNGLSREGTGSAAKS